MALLEQLIGEPFTIHVVTADKKVLESRLTIEPLPKPDGAVLGVERFGLRLAALDAARAGRLGLRAGAGLLVEDVDRRGPAARTGIVAGDLITRVGPYGVRDLDELGVLLERLSAGNRVVLRVVRIERRGVYQAEAVVTAR